MINETVTTFSSCHDILTFSLECEMSNLATMIIELTIAFIFGGILTYFFYKKQKQHAESLAKINKNVTEKVYSRNIEYYTCDFRFDELQKENPDAETKALKISNEFVKNLEKTAKNIRDIEIPGRGKAHEVEFEEGNVRISLPYITIQNYPEGLSKTANIHVQTDKFPLIDKIITFSKRPYWDFQLHVEGKYDVHQMILKIEEETGKKPLSKSGTGGGDKTQWDMATYTIMNVKNISVACTLAPDKINLTCISSGPNQGFYRAHKIFSPGKIIAILFGEMDLRQIREMINESLKSP